MEVTPLVHETFVIEVVVDTTPSQVFAAYADVHIRGQWASPPSDAIVYDRADFHVEGKDAFRCGPTNDLRFHGDVTYHDIVENERFVFVETIRARNQMLSLSMVTWELLPEGRGTRLRSTVQMISFVGPQMLAGAKSGTRAALNSLTSWLAHTTSSQ